MATVIKVVIEVEKIANVLTIFDVIKVYRSTTGETGVFTELTGPGTRVPLVAGTTVYFFDDVTGDPDYWYKTSYFHETTLAESALSAAIRGDAELLYVGIDEIRAEGVTTATADDGRVLTLIRTWQEWIDRVTNNWFVERSMTLEIDGDGTKLKQLPFPIVSVSQLFINDDFDNAVDTDDYRVYNGRGGTERDDRKNPRIKLLSSETSIFEGTGAVRRRTSIFEVGEKNQKVVGIFGYVEIDGSVPRPIEYALTKLVVRSASKMRGTVVGGVPGGPLIEEEVDRHRRKWADPFVGTKHWSKSGDPEIDQILAMYKRPLHVGTPRTMFRRLRGRGSL